MRKWISGRSISGLVCVGLLTVSIATGCGVPALSGQSLSVGNRTAGGHPEAVKTVMYGMDLQGDTVTLHLISHEKTPPKDMPPVQETVRLPLYPSAEITSKGPGLGEAPNSPYLIYGTTGYILPCTMQAAQSWYNNQMKKAGYKSLGTGEYGNIHHPQDVAKFTTYQLARDSGLRVELNFQPQPNGHTLLQYSVTTILTPERPRSTIIPTDVTQIDVTYDPGSGGTGKMPPAQTKTITDQVTIQKWTAAVNSLPRDTRGPHGDLADYGQMADLVFVTKNGQRYDVHLWYAALSARVNGGPGLMLGSIWNMVKETMQP